MGPGKFGLGQIWVWANLGFGQTWLGKLGLGKNGLTPVGLLHKFFFAPYRMYLCKTVSTVQHDACIYWPGMFTLLIHLIIVIHEES